MGMAPVKPGELIKIQYVIYGESFQLGNYVVDVITVSPGLCAASDAAIKEGWVPRMVRCAEDGTEMLWLFEMNTLVTWLGVWAK